MKFRVTLLGIEELQLGLGATVVLCTMSIKRLS
jgi:hypothetical protein